METAISKSKFRMTPKLVAAIATVLFIAALSGVLILQNKNWNLDQVLQDTRIQQERLVSEKLQLEKSVANFKNELEKMKGTNQEMNDRISAQLA